MATSILLVDDDPETRKALAELLRARGLVVDEARDGREALERLAARRPSVVVTDLVMPEMSGWDLVREMKQSAALTHIPVVVLSASAPGEIGADVRLRKPCPFSRILSAIRDLLARRPRGRPSFA